MSQNDLFSQSGPQWDLDTLRAAAKAKAERCECCGALRKVYRRSIHTGMALALIWMVRHRPGGWVHMPSEAPPDAIRSREYPKLRLWGLLEERKGWNGYWRATEKGERFAMNQEAVPSALYDLRGKIIGQEPDTVTIVEAVGNRFDYERLMRGEG